MSKDITQDRTATVAEKTSRPTPDSIPKASDPSRWHKTSSLPDGTPIGRLGAYWHILDQDGCAISDGYHEIYCDEDGVTTAGAAPSWNRLRSTPNPTKQSQMLVRRLTSESNAAYIPCG